MGGIESFLLNVYNLIDREKIQFDFIEYGESERDFNSCFIRLGAKIYNLPNRKRHPILARRKLKKIIKENRYQVVHIHKNSLADVGAITVCKKIGISRVIVHSHNSHRDSNFIVFLHKINRRWVNMNTVIKFACSKKAAEWMFGCKENSIIVKNGIDTKRFLFDSQKRDEIRKKLKIEEFLVLGNVGRLTEQKNPMFILEILKELSDNNICFLWVGDGKLKKSMEKIAEEYGVRNRIHLVGTVDNPEDYYQAMDIFVMPSLYEGFPIAAVEAQCTGLPCVLSNKIDPETDIMGEIEWASIVDVSSWVNAINKIKNRKMIRKSNHEELRKKGYDIKSTAKYVSDFYLKGNEVDGR